MSNKFQSPHHKTNPLQQINSTMQTTMRPGPRSRTSSFLSISSTASTRSASDILRTSMSWIREPIPSANSRDSAYGSFVPVRSAASTLKGFGNRSSPLIIQVTPERKRVTFVDPLSSSKGWPEDHDNEPPVQVPFITRTFPPPVCPPSPVSSTSSIINHAQLDHNPDLHPILARLEKKSKLCTQMSQCATCHKTGSDFPRCGKCSQMWCSRQCRLVGGKRHVCPS